MQKQIQREFLYSWNMGPSWHPGFLQGKDASAGLAWGDQLSLVRLLELHMGIPVREVSMLDRFMEALTGIRAYCEKNPAAYFAESFRQDDIAVARHLIIMRDELMMAGWAEDAAVLPERPSQAMQALALCGDRNRLSGFPDRIRAVIDRLRKHSSIIVNSLHVVRDINSEPVLMQKLISSLSEKGTVIRPWQATPVPEAGGESDLSRVRKKLGSGINFRPKGDGSLVLLQGNNNYDSAEALACWLRINEPRDVVIIADEESRAALNDAFRRQHLAASGAESISPYRGTLQILRLFLSLQWKPLDPARLLEFLQLPVSPLPRKAARLLAETVAQTPGIGSHDWNAAIKECLEVSSDPEKLLERFKHWLPDEDSAIESNGEMPVERLFAACRNVSHWARKRYHAMEGIADSSSGGDTSLADILRMTSAQAERLEELVSVSGLRSINYVRLMRLLDKVSSGGMKLELYPSEKESFPVISSPSELLGPAHTVIWWNFTRTAKDYFPDRIFSETERENLSKKGIIIPGPEQLTRRLSREWRQPVQYAAFRLVLVKGLTDLGEQQGMHPLWDELSAGWDDTARSAVTIHTRDLLKNIKRPINVETTGIAPNPLPIPVSVFHLDNVLPRLREKESASSLESLAGCPLKYILQYQAGLRPSGVADLAHESVVKGNIGHHMIQEVFSPGRKFATLDEAENTAAAVFDLLVSREGATLLLPGGETDLADFRRAMIRVAGIFWQLLHEEKLTVTGIESERSARTELGQLEGYIDLLLSDRNNQSLVLDMKYSERGDKYYRARLEENKSVQLAVYSRLFEGDIPVAYMSLKDAQVITTEHNAFPGAHIIGNSSISDTWDRLVTTVKHIIKEQFKNKLITAAGVALHIEKIPDNSLPEDALLLDPPCSFCDYSCLCGYCWLENGGRA